MLCPVSEVADMQTRLDLPVETLTKFSSTAGITTWVSSVMVKVGSVGFVGTTVGPRTCQALLYLAHFLYRAAICRTHNVQIREPIYKEKHFCDVQISLGRKSIKKWMPKIDGGLLSCWRQTARKLGSIQERKKPCKNGMFGWRK